MKEKIALARLLLKEHGQISAAFLQYKLKISFESAEKLVKAVVKEVFHPKVTKNKEENSTMSMYELKAHQRLMEVEIAQNLLNVYERSSKQGLGAKDQLDALVFELQLMAKKPIVPIAKIESEE